MTTSPIDKHERNAGAQSMSHIYQISDDYVEKIAEVNPITATALGVKGYGTELGAFSPDGNNKNASLAEHTLKELELAHIESDDNRRAREVMIEDINTEFRLHKVEEHHRPLNIFHSPMHSIRMFFDQMSKNTTAQWENISERLSKVPEVLSGYVFTSREGVEKKSWVSSVRQNRSCAIQAATWSGADEASSFSPIL